MLRIEITPLKTGVHHFVLEPDAAALDLDPEKFRDLRVEARLDVHERQILVSLTASATAQLECDRTLQLFDQRIEGGYHVLFAEPDRAAAPEDAYDEVRVLQPADQELDLTAAVRDTLLLAIPQRCIAPGVEDLEIETVFGAPEGEDDESVDPRWEALRRLRPRDEDPT